MKLNKILIFSNLLFRVMALLFLTSLVPYLIGLIVGLIASFIAWDLSYLHTDINMMYLRCSLLFTAVMITIILFMDPYWEEYTIRLRKYSKKSKTNNKGKNDS